VRSATDRKRGTGGEGRERANRRSARHTLEKKSKGGGAGCSPSGKSKVGFKEGRERMMKHASFHLLISSEP